jgi:hypothetical protein
MEERTHGDEDGKPCQYINGLVHILTYHDQLALLSWTQDVWVVAKAVVRRQEGEPQNTMKVNASESPP